MFRCHPDAVGEPATESLSDRESQLRDASPDSANWRIGISMTSTPYSLTSPPAGGPLSPVFISLLVYLFYLTYINLLLIL